MLFAVAVSKCLEKPTEEKCRFFLGKTMIFEDRRLGAGTQSWRQRSVATDSSMLAKDVKN